MCGETIVSKFYLDIFQILTEFSFTGCPVKLYPLLFFEFLGYLGV